MVAESILSEYVELLKILFVDTPIRNLNIVYLPQTLESMKRHLETLKIECSERFACPHASRHRLRRHFS
jgi:hypothetical protein